MCHLLLRVVPSLPDYPHLQSALVTSRSVSQILTNKHHGLGCGAQQCPCSCPAITKPSDALLALARSMSFLFNGLTKSTQCQKLCHLNTLELCGPQSPMRHSCITGAFTSPQSASCHKPPQPCKGPSLCPHFPTQHLLILHG